MTDAKFQSWLDARAIDIQTVEPEIQATLQARYVAECRANETTEAKQPTRIVLDGRGCSWPARVHRVEVQL
jgi:hypothetical protein